MKKKLLKDFLFHFMIFASPAYIALSYRISDIMVFNTSVINYIGILDWTIKNKTKIVIFLAFILPFIFTYLKRLIEEMANQKEESFYRQMYDISGKIFVVLNDVLSVKRKSVLTCIEKYKNQENNEIILSDVIKPTEQILKIFEGINFIFKKLTDNDLIKISIIECENQKMFKYLYQSDDEARTNIDELNQKRSTARQCITKKRLVIHQKTNGLISRHWFYGDNKRIKSIMCFPIISGKNTLYVISLTSKEDNTFKEKDRIKYELIFEQLSNRIMLESYLSILINKS